MDCSVNSSMDIQIAYLPDMDRGWDGSDGFAKWKCCPSFRHAAYRLIGHLRQSLGLADALTCFATQPENSMAALSRRWLKSLKSQASRYSKGK